PTDEAFKALPKGTVESLLKPENRKKLTAILALHVIPGKLSAGDALNAKQAKSLGGESLVFGIEDGRLKVNCATILKTDISADNGVIHVIDSVILPADEPKNLQPKESVSKVSPVALIESAIEKGVPIFNDGDHSKCAQIYRDCLLALANDKRIEGELGTAMRGLIERANKIESDTQRAWVFRSGLDHVYSALLKS
ncbi:UNVERIFIED_CONTAM: hypothetical protein GTU68_025542, partial [Idotea baltica]|nr:hypothetical protein [Idotea baltica]